MAAVVHGLFFGRIAPPSQRAPRDHRAGAGGRPPGGPDPPGRRRRDARRRDAERDVRAGPEHPGVAVLRPSGSTGRPPTSPQRVLGDAAPPAAYRRLSPPQGRIGAVPLYRDEAIVLRTQKLGEADRIITLLTREHGRVRAVAKGVRRTTSRFGSRLEPFTHVDLQLAEGRTLDMVTQAETLDAVLGGAGRGLRALHRRHGDARDRRAAGLGGEAARAAAVPAARRRAARDGRRGAPARPGARLLPAALARGRGLRAVVRALRPLRRARARTGGSTRRWAGCCARPAGCPGSATPAPETVAVLGALLAGDWPVVEAADAAAPREASGLVAAYLAWHLERGLRSLAYVER